MYQQIADAIQELPNQSMHRCIQQYVLNGQPMGDFLTYIFENNLVEAAAKADDVNQHLLFDYAKLLFQLPVQCYGSREAVKAWIERGGLNRDRAAKNYIDHRKNS